MLFYRHKYPLTLIPFVLVHLYFRSCVFRHTLCQLILTSLNHEKLFNTQTSYAKTSTTIPVLGGLIPRLHQLSSFRNRPNSNKILSLLPLHHSMLQFSVAAEVGLTLSLVFNLQQLNNLTSGLPNRVGDLSATPQTFHKLSASVALWPAAILGKMFRIARSESQRFISREDRKRTVDAFPTSTVDVSQNQRLRSINVSSSTDTYARAGHIPHRVGERSRECPFNLKLYVLMPAVKVMWTLAAIGRRLQKLA